MEANAEMVKLRFGQRPHVPLPPPPRVQPELTLLCPPPRVQPELALLYPSTARST